MAASPVTHRPDRDPSNEQQRAHRRKRLMVLAFVFGSMLAVGIPSAIARTRFTESVDITNLRLGKTSTSPQKNALWTCRSSYPANAVGAFKVGPWIRSDGTWDLSKKFIVDGEVKWSNARQRITAKSRERKIVGNGLPRRSTTGAFPVADSDDAYAYDRNPNSIRAQTISLSIPATPKIGPAPQCVPNAVGITLDGPAIFNAVDEAGRDAVAYELQDRCNGHPEVSGTYHYHGLSACAKKSSQYGWALDGFAIWGPIDPITKKEWSNNDLDECHGITSKIVLNGRSLTAYHYVANNEFPYTVGCFRGTPSTAGSLGSPPQNPPNQSAPSNNQPPNGPPPVPS